MSTRATAAPIAMAALLGRSVRRLARQPARVAATLGTPLLIWIVAGSGFAGSFAPPGAAASAASEGGYLAFLVPGMITMAVLFTAIFASIGVIEDRRDGWLQAVLTAPIPRRTLAAGLIAGTAVVALLQGLLLLPLVAVVGTPSRPDGWLLGLAGVAVTAWALSAVGLCFAWRSASSAEFHAVMNLVLMPMWLLSGAIFPIDGAMPWLRAIMLANPLSWCTTSIRAGLDGTLLEHAGAWPLAASAAFAVAATVVATQIMRRAG
jgi:ABC-2 type transport system permease protein